MISNETSSNQSQTTDKDELKIEIGDVIDTNQLPGVPEIFKDVMSRPIPQDRVLFLRENFYKNFSEEEILLIERTIIFQFEKFGKIARWVYDRENKKPFIEEFGVNVNSSSTEKFQAINRMSQNQKISTAFANIEMVEDYLRISGNIPLREVLLKIANSKGEVGFIDVGCGGQAVDIQLLLDPNLIGEKVIGTGISAFDYGENIRSGFPELAGRIFFNQINVYTDKLETKGDLVFSVRTLAYTGVIDAIRFLRALHDMATDDGIIWLTDVGENSFDFRNSKFDNLADFLLSLKSKFPSLKFSNEKGDYVIHWDKSEGFPFEGFVAKEIKYSDSNLPYLVRYEVPSR